MQAMRPHKNLLRYNTKLHCHSIFILHALWTVFSTSAIVLPRPFTFVLRDMCSLIIVLVPHPTIQNYLF